MGQENIFLQQHAHLTKNLGEKKKKSKSINNDVNNFKSNKTNNSMQYCQSKIHSTLVAVTIIKCDSFLLIITIFLICAWTKGWANNRDARGMKNIILCVISYSYNIYHGKNTKIWKLSTIHYGWKFFSLLLLLSLSLIPKKGLIYEKYNDVQINKCLFPALPTALILFHTLLVGLEWNLIRNLDTCNLFPEANHVRGHATKRVTEWHKSHSVTNVKKLHWRINVR